MAGEAYNLWGSPTAAAGLPTGTLAAGSLRHSSAIAVPPGTSLANTGVQISCGVAFGSNPTIGNSIELLIWRHDGTNYYGNVSATGTTLAAGAALEQARDGAHLVRRLTSSGANAGLNTFGGIILDPSQSIVVGIYNGAAVATTDAPTITLEFFSIQGQS